MTDEVQEQARNNLGGITGKGFMPGQSGNPGGRPKGSKSLRNLLIEALRKKAKDGRGNEREFYDVLVESIIVNAAKGNAALVRLIFDHVQGPPLQKHEVTEFIYQGNELRETVRKLGELMRDFVPRERWGELGARLSEIDSTAAE